MSQTDRPWTSARVACAAMGIAAFAAACSGFGARGRDLPTQGPAPATFTPAPPAPPATPVEVQSPGFFPLSERGPWLVYPVPDGLRIANPGGSGGRLLYAGEVLLRDVSSFASPHGGLLAFYTFEDPTARTGPTLKVIRLPHGTEVLSTPLLSASIQKALRDGAEPGSLPWQAAQAIGIEGSLAWSPEGNRLAFVAALDGPSSDLYVYDVARDQRRRVTSGPNQVANLAWSTDGAWVFNQAIESFGPGPGWRVGPVWAVDPGTTQQFKLYSPGGDGEVFVGWPKGGGVIAYSTSADGPRDLRAAGFGGVERIIVDGGFSDAAYDPESGTVAIAALSGATIPGFGPGAHLWHPVQGLTTVNGGNWEQVVWSPGAGRFYFAGPAGVLAVDPESSASDSSPVAGQVLASPDGLTIAIWERDPDPQGIHLMTADLEPIAPARSGRFTYLAWSPDSASLLALGAEGLVRIPIDGPLVPIDPEAQAEPGRLGWVAP